MVKKETPAFKKYNELTHPARVQFLLSEGINYFMCEQNKTKLHAFLLSWTVNSIAMTEQVENWIQRAGEKCTQNQMAEVGEKLKHHAHQEADHDLMLVDDAQQLIELWNTKYNDNMTASDITYQKSTTETNAYVQLHEDTINGKHPYAQAAIEYEIERISVVYGPRMLENIHNVLGEQFNNSITFLAEHVLLDQGHTKFNLDLMERCLANGGDVTELARVGSTALQIYSEFLTKCIQHSTQIENRIKCSPQLTT